MAKKDNLDNKLINLLKESINKFDTYTLFNVLTILAKSNVLFKLNSDLIFTNCNFKKLFFIKDQVIVESNIFRQFSDHIACSDQLLNSDVFKMIYDYLLKLFYNVWKQNKYENDRNKLKFYELCKNKNFSSPTEVEITRGIKLLTIFENLTFIGTDTHWVKLAKPCKLANNAFLGKMLILGKQCLSYNSVLAFKLQLNSTKEMVEILKSGYLLKLRKFFNQQKIVVNIICSDFQNIFLGGDNYLGWSSGLINCDHRKLTVVVPFVH